MPRPPNPTIGTVKCPMRGDVAAVRKDRNGKLYYIGAAGKVTPNSAAGQNWLLENADLWSDPDKPPAGIPAWIMLGLTGPGEVIPAELEPEPETPPANPEPATVAAEPAPEPAQETRPAPPPARARGDGSPEGGLMGDAESYQEESKPDDFEGIFR